MSAPESLRALIASSIDYAGLYPPAGLPIGQVASNYERYRRSPESWMLNRLVLPIAKLGEANVQHDWRISLLADSQPPSLLPQVETIETKTAVSFPLPVYRELPLEDISDGFAKLRTGALTPEAIPDIEDIAQFLLEARDRKLAFKATAGLHHPLRAERALTYKSDSPRAPMHGFINVFASAVFAWRGADEDLLLPLLAETDAAQFQWTDAGLEWRGNSLSTRQIRTARRDFVHSFGSCSFEEPVQDLRDLGWL